MFDLLVAANADDPTIEPVWTTGRVEAVTALSPVIKDLKSRIDPQDLAQALLDETLAAALPKNPSSCAELTMFLATLRSLKKQVDAQVALFEYAASVDIE